LIDNKRFVIIIIIITQQAGGCKNTFGLWQRYMLLLYFVKCGVKA